MPAQRGEPRECFFFCIGIIRLATVKTCKLQVEHQSWAVLSAGEFLLFPRPLKKKRRQAVTGDSSPIVESCRRPHRVPGCMA